MFCTLTFTYCSSITISPIIPAVCKTLQDKKYSWILIVNDLLHSYFVAKNNANLFDKDRFRPFVNPLMSVNIE